MAFGVKVGPNRQPLSSTEWVSQVCIATHSLPVALASFAVGGNSPHQSGSPRDTHCLPCGTSGVSECLPPAPQGLFAEQTQLCFCHQPGSPSSPGPALEAGAGCSQPRTCGGSTAAGLPGAHFPARPCAGPMARRRPPTESHRPWVPIGFCLCKLRHATGSRAWKQDVLETWLSPRAKWEHPLRKVVPFWKAD